ncbi:hypothetical protein LWI29_005645 [Acer saccharum]|uniref:Uncharacterized protein n=1 Tax=Acer saccharum TaxID=4024 RepID=A0AA39W6L8_ACESA|nr:hypothetical protein LWI29_005645 [Acer saccharum]
MQYCSRHCSLELFTDTVHAVRGCVDYGVGAVGDGVGVKDGDGMAECVGAGDSKGECVSDGGVLNIH